MGYYTDYTINATGFKTEEEAEFFEFLLNKESDYKFKNEGIGGLDGDFEIEWHLGEAKFYDYKDVFSSLAKRFPSITIDVYGEGEEAGDIWKHRFRDTQDERLAAELIFPEFNL